MQLPGSVFGLALVWLLPGMQRCSPEHCPGNLKHLWALHLLTHQPGWRVAPWSWSCPEAQSQPGRVVCHPLTEEQILPFSSSAGKCKERNEGRCKRQLLCLLVFLFNEGYRKKENGSWDWKNEMSKPVVCLRKIIFFFYWKKCFPYCISFHLKITAVKQRNTNSLLCNKDKCSSFWVTKIPLKKKKEQQFLISVPIAVSGTLQDMD